MAVVIEHTINDGGVAERIRRDVQSTLEGLDEVGRVDLAMRRKDQAPATGGPNPDPNQPRGIPGVKHVVAVASA
ncbi:hypothetical protein DF186_25725, partial [Enterococcus hirae]